MTIGGWTIHRGPSLSKSRPQRSGVWRWFRFNAVGILGFAVQMATLVACIRLLRINYLIATVLSVEVAIVHNFVWHERWTWADRGSERNNRQLIQRFVRFNAGTGLVSLLGNIVLMRILIGMAQFNLIASSFISVLTCSILNFLIADRLIFCASLPASSKTERHSRSRKNG